MISTSKTAYIDKLAGTVNEYNDTYHRTIKIKSVDEESSTYIEFDKKIIRNIVDLKLVAV